MPTITLPHGNVHYRRTGPSTSTAPSVVFVHGFLVDSTLWAPVAHVLAADGVTSYAPDLPLGAHRLPVAASADQSPRGVARQLLAFMDALDLRDVTLVGNDTGGAICQYLLDTDASRVGRVVLTNCDAFEMFPPPALRRFVALARHPTAPAVAGQALRWTRLRHSALGFGPFATTYDATVTAAWAEPGRTNRLVRRDAARLARSIETDDMVAVSSRLHRFAGPVRLVWGAADPYFTLALARRLAAAFADAQLIEILGARTFVPLDAPARLAAEVLALTPNCPSEPARSGRSERTEAVTPGGSGRAAP